MIHLHLTREAFQKVKDGLKKSEFRPDNDYYNTHVWKVFEREMFKSFKRSVGVLCKIYCAYPKKDDKENIIECIVTSVSWLSYGHKNIDLLFYKYYPKYKGSVMQIDFEVV
jgi:hypothetical protein